MEDSGSASFEADVRHSTLISNHLLDSETKELSVPGILPAPAVSSTVTMFEITVASVC